ncbi:MAG: plasmid pRiA4b ORF-3 family protein [Xanthomonadales bacterium]|nr:plasmid pRiA4b ORF-3 family protein [Xanthomonadales bacterium]
MLFDWYDYHLYQFEIDNRRFEEPDEEAEGEDSTRAKLSKLITEPGQVFQYVYDFGDNWVHRIEVEDAAVKADPGWIPWLIDGARRGPPEDCGGIDGYQRLIEAASTPPESLDEDDRDFVRWAGDDFDPEEFSVSQARHALLLAAAYGCLKGR